MFSLKNVATYRTTWILAQAAFAFSQLLSPLVGSGEEAAPKKKELSFVRIMRDDKGQPLSFDTVVAHYVADKGTFVGAQVDLIGAVHVGEKSYYDQLNSLFTNYDAVLYELVAPEGTRVPNDGRPKVGNHPVSAIQSGMKSMLGLEHQLERIDYTKANLIHADMSPDDFAKSMKDRNESFMQFFFRALGQGIAKQSQDPAHSSDAQLLSALFAKDRNVRLKRAMAEQFEDLEGSMGLFDGEEGSTIITERNKKALLVLDRELRGGKKRIAIFYGAGHLPDMENRLIQDFGMRRNGEKWLTAWTLASDPPVANPVKK